MGKRLRLWQPGKVYNVTSRCVDRQFLLRPSHSLGNPLLREDADPDSLETWNKIVPKPSTINIVGASIGRALEKYPVPLYFAEAQINHLHCGISLDGHDKDGNSRLVTPYDASMFLQCSNSLIARFVNKQCGREGHVFSATARSEPAIDDAGAEDKLFYALTNPVKDNMVETVKQSPFFNTYRHLAYGDPLRYWYIDWHGAPRGADRTEDRKESSSSGSGRMQKGVVNISKTGKEVCKSRTALIVRDVTTVSLTGHRRCHGESAAGDCPPESKPTLDPPVRTMNPPANGGRCCQVRLGTCHPTGCTPQWMRCLQVPKRSAVGAVRGRVGHLKHQGLHQGTWEPRHERSECGSGQAARSGDVSCEGQSLRFSLSAGKPRTWR